MWRVFTVSSLSILTCVSSGCQASSVGSISGESDQLWTRVEIEERAQNGFEQYKGLDGSYTPWSSDHDLNHDGIDELFIALPWTAGNAGMSHEVYERCGEKYRLLGNLFFHPRAFRVLPATSQHPIRLARYLRSSGTEGLLETLTYENGQFVVLTSETIHPGDAGTDEGRRRYAEMFSN